MKRAYTVRQGWATVHKRDREISSYFELGGVGVEVLEEGLKEMPFGEFLVEQGALTRTQLLAAMMEQDRNPGIPLGEVVAYLGYLSYVDVDRLLTVWSSVPVVEVA
jgi:hypothetical protein